MSTRDHSGYCGCNVCGLVRWAERSKTKLASAHLETMCACGSTKHVVYTGRVAEPVVYFCESCDTPLDA